MGQIIQDVRDNHLKRRPEEEGLLKSFLVGFDVTWAGTRNAFNTDISIYFLKPETFISQMFGFEHEIAFFVSKFSKIEARTMQAVESLMSADPARGRVDQSVFFLATPASGGKQWIADYSSLNPRARVPVVFDSNELKANGNDAWLIRNKIREQLFSRDLFDYQLPLDSDVFFFGRDAVVADHLDAIKRSQNRGLFGLRKTGKTSVIYKLQRIMQRDKLGAFLYYDCKFPAIRMLRWHQLLARVVRDIANAYDLKVPESLDDPVKVSDHLIDVLKQTPEDQVTALVFDEIEYVSPLAVDDVHWHKEFVPFWQTLWSAQSQVRRLSNTVAGVNPRVVEMDTVAGVQNPMFGIVQPRYLRGFTPEEMRGLVRFFGRRMGLSFTLEAFEYLQERYGGHPLLIRMACSKIHEACDRKGVVRPIKLGLTDVQEDAEGRDAELVYYCGHVVSELKRFYPDEYAFLEMLASGQIVDAMSLQDEPEYTRHLKEYGLLTIDAVNRPVIAIPVVGRYVGNELARRERRRLIRRVVPVDERSYWVQKRVETTTREMRDLCRIIDESKLPSLFGANGFPEAERFLASKVVVTNNDFVEFINICNRCFVESIERHGKTVNVKDYFWTTIKKGYPDLWEGLQRIKTYRHNDLHLDLTTTAAAELKRYVDGDLEGRRVAQVQDVWFVFQQSVLDGLLLGVQCELGRYS
jgi:hypothetical protein